GQELLVTDFVKDPRVFVFLRQQLDSHGADQKLDELLVDSLIVYVLEGTDPEKGLFKTRAQISDAIKQITAFDAKQMDRLLDQRLEYLATKPRRIRFYDDGRKYCLPFETRVEIEEQKLTDEALFQEFCQKADERLKTQLAYLGLPLKNVSHIVGLAFNE